MTSLTGATPMTGAGTISPPAWSHAILGALLQNAALLYTWAAFTPFGACLGADLRACAADAWARSVVFALLLCTLTWLLSLRSLRRAATSDPSIVDRLWSICPWVYVWYWLACAPAASRPRVLLMALLSTAWGARLTYNFYLKGGFHGGEDYRWAVIRTWFAPGLRWELFNFMFICFAQQLIILAFSSPAAAAAASAAPLGRVDVIAATLFALLLLGEAVADRQMLAFQTEKYRRIHAGEPAGEYAAGFIESGLWAFSRHPNYFCEVSMWWAFYLFSIPSTGALLNWTLPGPLFLTALFCLPRASLDVTEALSSRKYPRYAEYQRRVSRFVPLPPTAKGAAWIGWAVFFAGLAALIQNP